MNGRLSGWPMFNASMARLLVSPHRSRRKPPASPSLWIERMEERRVCAVVIGLANDTGASRIDRVTSDPTIALSRPIAAGQRVDYTVNGGPSQTAVMIDSRRFMPAGLDTDGRYRVVATIIDASGRSLPPARPLTITVDRTVAPLAVVLAQDTGPSAADSITSNARLSITGVEVRSRVQYSRDTVGFDPLTAVWGAYRPQTGANRWWVRQVDAAGNASTPVEVAFTLDTSTDKARRLEGPQATSYTAVPGVEVSWTVEFDQPMHVGLTNGALPALKFTFRGRELYARYREGSGATRLTYTYQFTDADAGTGALAAPLKICLCYGGAITDAAGNRLRKHPLPPVTATG
jgi:hypothetical protein